MSGLWQRIGAARSDASQVAAFGLILYSRADVHLRKLLDDPDYVAALDAVSGFRWTVFYARVGSHAGPVAGGPVQPRRLQESPDRPEQEPSDALLEAFGLQPRDVPCLLVFVPLDDDQAVVRHLRLQADSLEQAFTSLREAIGTITEVFDDIAPAHLQDAEGLVAALDLRLVNDRHRRLAGRMLSLVRWLRSFMPRLPG
ncbi:MAG: hypothetical protein ACK4PH_10800 [Aquincola tertiaricarbonis]|uniref:hypothetical protein n=1 Tax=Aquincola TaxID=391952 RepID=UPI000614F67F|nr:MULTISPECIES: hypothetical protein [Aquincola]MCR5867243.1 hypothetical protein [Aquincola sp. J276]